MLPRDHRLGDSAGFVLATRSGRRAGGRAVVVHLGRDADQDALARIGLIVGRGVGNSVVRNRVKRRLRHLLRDRVALLPPASVVAVRALPASARMSSTELGGDLDRCLSRLSVSSGATQTSEAVSS